MKTKKKKNEPQALYWEEPTPPEKQSPAPVQRESSAPATTGGEDYLAWLDRKIGTAHAQAAAREQAAAPPQEPLG